MRGFGVIGILLAVVLAILVMPVVARLRQLGVDSNPGTEATALFNQWEILWMLFALAGLALVFTFVWTRH